MVNVDQGVSVRQVRYYWYREDEEPLGTQQGEAALVGTVASTPPYGGMLKVPAYAPSGRGGYDAWSIGGPGGF